MNKKEYDLSLCYLETTPQPVVAKFLEGFDELPTCLLPITTIHSDYAEKMISKSFTKSKNLAILLTPGNPHISPLLTSARHYTNREL
jgi:hypothetical protein